MKQNPKLAAGLAAAAAVALAGAAEKTTYQTKFPDGPVAKYKVTMPNVPAQYILYPEKGLSVIFR